MMTARVYTRMVPLPELQKSDNEFDRELVELVKQELTPNEFVDGWVEEPDGLPLVTTQQENGYATVVQYVHGRTFIESMPALRRGELTYVDCERLG